MALARLGSARTRKPRPSLRELEHLHFEGRPLARAESKAHRETSPVSPEMRKAPAHPLASGPEHLLPLLPAARRDGGGDGPLRVIVRFLGRLLLHLTGAPLLMVDPSEPNLPPIAVNDDMPAANNMVAKVQNVYPVVMEDKIDAMDLHETKEISNNTPEDEPEQVDDCQETNTAPNDVFFDGLQFYKILTNVGRSAVQSAVDTAVARATQSIVAQRPLPQSTRPDSIAFIRERYPDFICLLPTATHPTRTNSSGTSHVFPRRPHSDSFPPRLDLLSALLLSSSSSSSSTGSSSTHRPPVKGAKEDGERAGSEQVRRAAALASPRAKLDGGFLRVA